MSSTEEITVQIIRRKPKQWPYFIFRWFDPVTGQGGDASSKVPKSAGKIAAAQAIPAFVEAKKALRPAPEGSWEAFCKRIDKEVAPNWRSSTRRAWGTVRNYVEEILDPGHLNEIDHSAVSVFKAELRDRQMAPASIDSYLRTLRSVLNEGSRMYPGYDPPKIKTGKHDPGGRPISRDEFAHLLKFVPKVVPNDRRIILSWRRLLQGLVWSGLRLGQAIDLRWEIAAPIHVENLDGSHPIIVIAKDSHKGKRNQRIPMMPPLVAILRRIPERERTGRVFKISTPRMFTHDVDWIGRIVSRIGRRAGIATGRRMKKFKVDVKDTDGNVIHNAGEAVEVIRYMSAHDLKRTCGQWLLDLGISLPVVSQILQHNSIDVTYAAYCQKDAECLGDITEKAFARHGKRKLPTPKQAPAGDS